MRVWGTWGIGLAGVLAIGAAACGGSSGGGGGGLAGTGASGGTAGSSGAGGVAGSAGSGGVPGLASTDKVDLLLVVDNSISMADKQAVLQSSAPRLVQRLVAPRCLDGSGQPTGSSAPCPAGTEPEFSPVRDMHVGVITSSLGPHGGNVCPDEPPTNDRAHLLPTVRTGLSNPNGLGFLEWKADTGDVGVLVSDIAQQVTAAGESGCGFESGLESWFRFLVDPNPPDSVTFDGTHTVASGTDTVLLDQRKAFLRPDSLLAIVVLTDENDCSVRDSDYGWYVSTIVSPNFTPYPLQKPTAICETDPNSPCCRPCNSEVPAGCDDVGCDGAPLDPMTTDKVGLRCFEQKRRFGLDFMYPTSRYVNALREKTLCPSRHDLDATQCEGPTAPNPLYQDLSGSGQPTRGSMLVKLVGIVGVPWQDLATANTLSSPTELRYLSASELAATDRWKWMTGTYGDPADDPLMIESSEPRTGQSPATGAPLAAPSSGPMANAANGHEFNAQLVQSGDLQFACIFPLEQPRDCDAVTGGCDCNMVTSSVTAGTYEILRPVCQDPTTGQYSSVQHFARAYPGLRYLEVLKNVGDQAVAASICPKVADPSAPAYGYGPAFDALVSAMSPHLITR